MNKKGDGTAITMVVSLIFIALVLVIMAMLFFFITPNSDLNIHASAVRDQKEVLLLNFLETSSGDRTVADLIILEDYDSVEEEIKSKLSPAIVSLTNRPLAQMVFQIEGNDNSKCWTSNNAFCSIGSGGIIAKLPGKDGDMTVKFDIKGVDI